MKEWVEGLLPYERDLFFMLNGSDSVFLDNVMWTISGRLIWIPLYLFILFLFFFRMPRKEAILASLFLILVVVLCDQVSSSLFKPLFERFRPTHHLDFMNLVDTVNDYRGGRYGFISGHATNSFGLAVFLSMTFRHRVVTITTLIWSTLNSYTRIYLGVHFVSDILAGMLAGSLIAVVVFSVYQWLRVKFIIQNYAGGLVTGQSGMIMSLSSEPGGDGAEMASVINNLTVDSRRLDGLQEMRKYPYKKYAKLFAYTLVAYLAFVIVFSPLLSMLPH